MDYIQSIRDAIRLGEASSVAHYVQKAIRYRYPPEAILENGIIAGIEQVAEKFKEAKICLPEVLMSARAFHIGVKTVTPFLPANQQAGLTKVVIGTVAGDIHDIGKNIIVTTMSTIGCNVIDLGVNIPSSQFVETVRQEQPDILMLSSLLTTTTAYMKEVIDMLETENLRKNMKIFVGGGPVTKEFAKKIGADYYTSNAFELKDLILKLISTNSL